MWGSANYFCKTYVYSAKIVLQYTKRWFLILGDARTETGFVRVGDGCTRVKDCNTA